jgi:hypothetical protein
MQRDGPYPGTDWSIKNDHFLFGLIFIKKIISKLIFFKNRNRFKSTSFVSFRFFREVWQNVD